MPGALLDKKKEKRVLVLLATRPCAFGRGSGASGGQELKTNY